MITIHNPDGSILAFDPTRPPHEGYAIIYHDFDGNYWCTPLKQLRPVPYYFELIFNGQRFEELFASLCGISQPRACTAFSARALLASAVSFGGFRIHPRDNSIAETRIEDKSASQFRNSLPRFSVRRDIKTKTS